ncbi:uncharacterized protein LOC141812454 [Curcuma longa]|uniref:uncharacterized protein LOC141812454 n=1 Tax=Curcuma longa TaxID=136217 RepID=UPI003D9EF788
MASSPPVSSSKIGDSITAIGAINGNATSQRSSAYGMPKPSLRGQNKPKCIKCGNVARSRCPFQSCKSCCAKAENPCHIHVLKQNGTLPDKPPTSSSTSVEQPPNDVSSPSGSSWRLNSLRHASTNFVNILRAKKPLTKKDAINLNKWKFMKLREHLEGNVEAENEAFDRYVLNVSLLEETFSLPIMEEAEPQSQISSGSISSERLISEIKTKLKSDSQRTDTLRERIKNLIDQKLLELLNGELGFDDYETYDDDPDDVKEFKRSKMIMQSRYDKNASMADLISKLNRATSKEDLTACSDLMLQHRSNNLSGYQFTESKAALYFRSLPKMCSTVHVDQDALENINTEFSSLDHIFQL